MTEEEKLKQVYIRGYSYSRASQAHKVYPEAENPHEKYLQEFMRSIPYQEEILVDIRRLAGYETVDESVPYGYPPSGRNIYQRCDLEESFRMGLIDGLKDRSKLQEIDVRSILTM